MQIDTILLSACATFVYVFLKAMQQLNVVHNSKFWVVPTSVGMEVCAVGIVLLVVRADTIWLGVSNGLAGGLGALSAMWLHNYIHGDE
jgi:hypothetical protein